MMDSLGSFAVLLALTACAYAFLAGILAHVKKQAILGATARRAGVTIFPTLSVAMACLWGLFLTDDFSIAYVANHSNRDLPVLYKFAALWSGQEGSLLFWSWILSGYMFFVLLRHREEGELRPLAGVILAGVQLFFLILNAFIVSPFRVLAEVAPDGATRPFVPADGRGLNPLLQYPEMVLHPPTLYLGYVGFSVPFAFALAALITRSPGERWIHVTRRWTMIAWGFLTLGILMGAHWAYAVLGWGGYWAWDPVENASFMPWLTGTAFLHSVMMQERRGMLKVWNVWLVFITFLLCIFGTFLTRSGVVSSVHAFAQSPIGHWFVGFLMLVFAVCLFFFARRRDYLRSEHRLEAVLSREASFLFNNLVLLAACFAVLWGTLFPVISEAVTGSKVSVGPPFFNRVNIPIFLFLLLLTGVGPLLAWRRTSWESLKRNFTYPTLVGGGDRWDPLRLGRSGSVRAHGVRALGVCDGDDRERILSRGARHSHADRADVGAGASGADAAEHAAIWGIHRAFRHRRPLHRGGRIGVREGARDGDAGGSDVGAGSLCRDVEGAEARGDAELHLRTPHARSASGR